VIDDDLIVLKAIERLLRANDYPVEVFFDAIRRASARASALQQQRRADRETALRLERLTSRTVEEIPRSEAGRHSRQAGAAGNGR
jgi:FixJ family two-component response regulator